jgi:hypothetical protein
VRPGGLQSLRGIQAALADAIVPGLAEVYAQDVAQTTTMLVESLAADWDTAADDLRNDSDAVRSLLARAISLFSAGKGNEQPAALVQEIEEAVARPPAASLRISDLAGDNDMLRGALERTLVALEDIAAGTADAKALELREAIYSHLRIGAAAGWSFWDVASFRERMARLNMT